jgi:site-specific recombinase XerC
VWSGGGSPGENIKPRSQKGDWIQFLIAKTMMQHAPVDKGIEPPRGLCRLPRMEGISGQMSMQFVDLSIPRNNVLWKAIVYDQQFDMSSLGFRPGSFTS